MINENTKEALKELLCQNKTIMETMATCKKNGLKYNDVCTGTGQLRFPRWIICLALACFLPACAASRCECENNREYKPKKVKISLMDKQKNTTFALRNSSKKEL